MTLKKIKQTIRKSKKWGFLAEMVGETSLPGATMGVNHQGILLINPADAAKLSPENLIDRVRHEFRVAAELRKTNGFV